LDLFDFICTVVSAMKTSYVSTLPYVWFIIFCFF